MCTIVHNVEMKPSEILRGELKSAFDEFGGKGLLRFEGMLGFPKHGLRGILDPDMNQVPSVDKAEQIAKALGLELYIGPPRSKALTPDEEDFRTVTYSDIAASAGWGANADKGDELKHAFRTGWLKRKNINPARASLIRIRGDSMSPKLEDGDLALINEADTEHLNRRIFVFERGGDLYVKRLTRYPRAGLLIESDNTLSGNYPTELLTPSDANRIRVLGRVVWHCSDL